MLMPTVTVKIPLKGTTSNSFYKLCWAIQVRVCRYEVDILTVIFCQLHFGRVIPSPSVFYILQFVFTITHGAEEHKKKKKSREGLGTLIT